MVLVEKAGGSHVRRLQIRAQLVSAVHDVADALAFPDIADRIAHLENEVADLRKGIADFDRLSRRLEAQRRRRESNAPRVESVQRRTRSRRSPAKFDSPSPPVTTDSQP